jgi:hypothetical protein
MAKLGKKQVKISETMKVGVHETKLTGYRKSENKVWSCN